MGNGGQHVKRHLQVTNNGGELLNYVLFVTL